MFIACMGKHVVAVTQSFSGCLLCMLKPCLSLATSAHNTAWHVQVIDDPSTDSLFLVMEHVDGGSLEQRYDAVSKTWDTLPESLVHRQFRELCKVCYLSLSSLHSVGCASC